MKNTRMALLALVLISSYWAPAQEGQEPSSSDALNTAPAESGPAPAAEQPPGESADEASTPAPTPKAKVRKGDIITFKTGRVLSSVQVRREGVLGLEVEILPGMPPLKIPMDQVESVEYDDIDPGKPSSLKKPDQPGTPDVMLAEELEPEFHRKLTAMLDPADRQVNQLPVLNTLPALAAKMAVPLEISESVRQLPEPLLWKSDLPENISFLMLLEDHLLKTFPELSVSYKFSKVTLMTRTDAESADAPEAELPDPLPGVDNP